MRWQDRGMTSTANADSTDRLLEDAAARARAYVRSIDARAVAPSAEAMAALDRFIEPLPDGPTDPQATLQMLDEVGGPATMATSGPRYYGFVNGATLPIALATSWITDAWDQNAALPVMSPVAARLHDVARDWLVALFGFPDGTEASFVTGATMANASAFAAARDGQLERMGWDVQRNGLFGAPEPTVVIGEKAHSTIGKALGLVGLGRERVIRVPADSMGRMRADRLPDVPPAGSRLRGDASHATVVAAGAPGRGMGGVAVARPKRCGRPRGVALSSGASDCGGSGLCRTGNRERRGAEPGARPCVERRCDFASYRRGAVPWHVLVRAHAVGRTCRHARLGIGVVND